MSDGAKAHEVDPGQEDGEGLSREFSIVESSGVEIEHVDDTPSKYPNVDFDIDPERLLGRYNLIDKSSRAKQIELLKILSEKLPEEYANLDIDDLKKTQESVRQIRNQSLVIGEEKVIKDKLYPLIKLYEELFRELQAANHPVTQLYNQALAFFAGETPGFFANLRQLLILCTGSDWVRARYNDDIKLIRKATTKQQI